MDREDSLIYYLSLWCLTLLSHCNGATNYALRHNKCQTYHEWPGLCFYAREYRPV